ncbi:MAG: hypothetical protein DRJ14_09010 [Acidobacteria bacterium]|nr:MAG: hypothetical protein DRJ14_09010 [Acidobacteriota bacterium]
MKGMCSVFCFLCSDGRREEGICIHVWCGSFDVPFFYLETRDTTRKCYSHLIPSFRTQNTGAAGAQNTSPKESRNVWTV